MKNQFEENIREVEGEIQRRSNEPVNVERRRQIIMEEPNKEATPVPANEPINRRQIVMEQGEDS